MSSREVLACWTRQKMTVNAILGNARFGGLQGRFGRLNTTYLRHCIHLNIIARDDQSSMTGSAHSNYSFQRLLDSTLYVFVCYGVLSTQTRLFIVFLDSLYRSLLLNVPRLIGTGRVCPRPPRVSRSSIGTFQSSSIILQARRQGCDAQMQRWFPPAGGLHVKKRSLKFLPSSFS